MTTIPYTDQARGAFLAESSAGQLERHFATCKACEDSPLGYCPDAMELIEPYLKPQQQNQHDKH